MRSSASALALLLCLLFDAVAVFAAPACHAGQPRGVASPAPTDEPKHMPCHGMAADEAPGTPVVRAAQRDCCAGHFPCGIASSTAVPLPQKDRSGRLPDTALALAFAERSTLQLLGRPLDHVPLA